MAKQQRGSRSILFAIFVLAFLIGLLIWKLKKRNGKNEEADVIRSVLQKYGMNERTINQWIAVSALETNGWSSQVYKDSNNLFALIVPNKPNIGYGEKQTIFATLEDAVEGLVKYVIKPFNYPLNFDGIEQQARTMKEKGYYGGTWETYAKNMVYWYQKLSL